MYHVQSEHNQTTHNMVTSSLGRFYHHSLGGVRLLVGPNNHGFWVVASDWVILLSGRGWFLQEILVKKQKCK